jgi:heat-inducible transcriptional repressor
MAHLEEMGYLRRSYASAGAVPSDKGYRFYVESIPDRAELPLDSKYTIRYQFTQADKDVDRWIEKAASVLSQLIGNAALVTYPRASEPRILGLDLVHLQESLVLLVLVLKGAKLRKQLLTMPEPMEDNELQQLSNKLSAFWGGLTRKELMSKPEYQSPFGRDVTNTVGQLMKQEEQSANTDQYVEGLSQLLGQPEFAGGKRSREILEAIEARELQNMILQEAGERGHVRVVIGGENRAGFLQSLSIVVCQYGLPGGGVGYISAIGPTRMEYPRAMGGVRFISSLMTELVSQVNG